MADTVDVAHVLFDIATGYEFHEDMPLGNVQPVEPVYWLERFSNTFRIGIEEARLLRRQKNYDPAPAMEQMKRELYLSP